MPGEPTLLPMTLAQELLAEVLTYIATRGIDPTNFGKAALNDPSFVIKLKAGRQPKSDTIDKVREFMRQAAA